MKALNLFTRSRSRILCSLILLLVMAPQIALADYIVLKDSYVRREACAVETAVKEDASICGKPADIWSMFLRSRMTGMSMM